MSFETSRRKMLSDSLAIGVAGAAYLPLLAEPLPQNTKTAKEKEPEVTATEDLMREHGIIRRALLVYYEVIPKLRQNSGSIEEALGFADLAQFTPPAPPKV